MPADLGTQEGCREAIEQAAQHFGRRKCTRWLLAIVPIQAEHSRSYVSTASSRGVTSVVSAATCLRSQYADMKKSKIVVDYAACDSNMSRNEYSEALLFRAGTEKSLKRGGPARRPNARPKTVPMLLNLFLSKLKHSCFTQLHQLSGRSAYPDGVPRFV